MIDAALILMKSNVLIFMMLSTSSLDVALTLLIVLRRIQRLVLAKVANS